MNSIKPSVMAAIAALSLMACSDQPHERFAPDGSVPDGVIPDRFAPDGSVPDRTVIGFVPNTPYRLLHTCDYPVFSCDDEFRECLDRAENTCLRCYEAGGLECSTYCSSYTDVCRGRHCDPTGECDMWAYTARRGDWDPAILRECERAAARHAACGDHTYYEDSCRLSAATERAERADFFECVANSACGEEADCVGPPPDEALSRFVCEATNECFVEQEDCNDDGVAEWLGWLRDDVKLALRRCAEVRDCEDRVRCMDVWADSIWPLE